jgi:hypothetical protein
MRCLRYISWRAPTGGRGMPAGGAIRFAGSALHSVGGAIRFAGGAILALGLLWGCAHPYKALRAFPGNPSCLEVFRPSFGSVVYHAQVDVIGRHLGGLLVIKTMPDSSIRLVFASEMGLTFFDFGFSREGRFTVYHIIHQMDKKAVIKTLRKDFELVLWEHTDIGQVRFLTDGSDRYYGFPQEKGINYYITDSACTHLLRAEKASRTKTIVTARLLDYSNGMPDSIFISHKKFPFTIALKRLEQ